MPSAAAAGGQRCNIRPGRRCSSTSSSSTRNKGKRLPRFSRRRLFLRRRENLGSLFPLFLVELELVEEHLLPGLMLHLCPPAAAADGIGYTAFVTARAATTALREGETARQYRHQQGPN